MTPPGRPVPYSLNVQRIPDGVMRDGAGIEAPKKLGTGGENEGGKITKSVPTLAAAAMPDLRSRFAGLSS